MHPGLSGLLGIGCLLGAGAAVLAGCSQPLVAFPEDAGPTPCAGEQCGCAADLKNDASNCGQCGKVCPSPVNAQATCRGGVCARGPCAAGYFDLDGEQTFGCEGICSGGTCLFPDGGAVVVHSVLPGPWSAFASGSSHGGAVQTSEKHTNAGVLGEPTPPGEGGAVQQASERHRNLGGFNAALRQ